MITDKNRLSRLKEKFESFSKSLSKLKEALEKEHIDDYILNATIQRFEFTYELAWKLLKEYLAYNGITDVRTPREVFKEAFATEIIGEGDIWIEMINDRNLTSHTYDEGQAKDIYIRIKKKYFPMLIKVRNTIGEKIGE